MVKKLNLDEQNEIFFDIWFSKKELESGLKPEYLDGVEKVISKALDDDNLRKALKEDPIQAADLAEVSLSNDEKDKLNSFIQQIDVLKLMNSTELDEQLDKILENKLPNWKDLLPKSTDDSPIPEIPGLPTDNQSDLPTLDPSMSVGDRIVDAVETAADYYRDKAWEATKAVIRAASPEGPEPQTQNTTIGIRG